MWFTEPEANRIRRLNLNGEFVGEFQFSPGNTVYSHITTGPDQNIWFTRLGTHQLGKLYVLSATGLTLENAVRAGQPLQAVVANFHDDEPGMLGSHYRVAIDWGDGEQSTGQAWRTAGSGNWVATGGHTYAQPGWYAVTVTLTDTHAPTGMSTTTYSYVEVTPGRAPGGNSPGALLPDAVAMLLREGPPTVALPGVPAAAPVIVPADALAWSPLRPREDAQRAVTADTTTAPADGWWDAGFVDVLAMSLLR